MARVPNPAKLLLFLSSYSPMYIIIALRAHDAEYNIIGHNISSFSIWAIELSLLSIAMIVLTLLSIGFLYWMIRSRRSRQGHQKEIENHRNRSDMFTEYLLVYIFPFIVFEFSNLYDVAAFFLLFITVATIVIRSDRLYVNPVLIAFRYRIYEVDTEHEQHLLLSKERLEGQEITLNTTKLSNGVYINTQ